MKARIGITAFPRDVDTVIGPTLLHTVSEHYVAGVCRAGGLPVILPVVDPGDVPALLDLVDGLVITGGGDVDPLHYGEHRSAHLWGVRPERDAFDLTVARAAVDAGLPTLAICRGLQVVNVALGGSLVQDVPTATGQVHSHREVWDGPAHQVRLLPSSRLAALLGGTEISVNSLHHQAVAEPAPGLRPVAWAEDGTVEAVEAEEHPRLLAVQWHPELLLDRPEHRRLFESLVEGARRVRA